MTAPGQPRRCDLDACHICTSCYHGQHDCARTITCPTTGNVNRCRCTCQGGRRNG